MQDESDSKHQSGTHGLQETILTRHGLSRRRGEIRFTPIIKPEGTAMDEILTQQMEALLGTQYSTKGLGKNILTLSGFLADYPLPEDIASQLERLSRLVVLQDQFDVLLQSLNQATAHTSPPRNDTASGMPPPTEQWRGRLLDQIESVRADINATSPINYSDLIAWLAGRARERNILRLRPRR